MTLRICENCKRHYYSESLHNLEMGLNLCKACKGQGKSPNACMFCNRKTKVNRIWVYKDWRKICDYCIVELKKGDKNAKD